MPFLIIIIGVMVLLTAIKGTYQQFGNQLYSDLAGASTSGSQTGGYIYWVSSIIAVGLLGYYSPLQKFSRTFMFLILLGMILANRGIFQQLQQALKQGPQASSGSASASATPSTQTASSGLSAGSASLASAGQAIELAAEAFS